MNKLAIIVGLAASLGLAGCAADSNLTTNAAAVQKVATKAVAAAPGVAADVQSYTTLNAALLTQIASANPNNATVQRIVAGLLKGNTATATDAQTLAAAAPFAGIAINAAGLAGQSISAALPT